MNKIIILIIIVTFTSFSKGQSIACDSCKGEATYSEQDTLNDTIQVSISTFKNICYNKDDNSVPRCYKINIISSNSLDTLQTLSDILFFSGSQPVQDIIKIQDVNFDGFDDLIILQNYLGDSRSFFHVYIYDYQKNIFVLREYYCVIFSGHWEIDYAKKTLFTRFEAGFHESVYHEYKFVNGDYVEVEEVN